MIVKPYLKNGIWTYTIQTIAGKTIHNCNGNFVKEYKDDTSTTKFHPHSSSSGHHIQHTLPNFIRQQQLGANQFEYPIGNMPMSVNHYGLSKNSDKWSDLVLQNEKDTQQFYAVLQS